MTESKAERRERHLKTAPLREMSQGDLEEALARGFMSEELFQAEVHRRRADALASPWERARERVA